MKRALVLLVVVLVAAAGAAVARGLQFRNAAKPGVHVLGVQVGGKSRAEIVRDLRAWSRHRVTIRTTRRSFHVERGWLVSVDAGATADRALAAGSELSLVVARPVDVAPGVGRGGVGGNLLGAL